MKDYVCTGIGMIGGEAVIVVMDMVIAMAPSLE